MDRNDTVQIVVVEVNASLSARRAWIEIRTRSQPSKPRAVALRKESVDRNTVTKPCFQQSRVALRKESVDRNKLQADTTGAETTQSLSARRAWIEMSNADTTNTSLNVALRKESVDRNIRDDVS